MYEYLKGFFGALLANILAKDLKTILRKFQTCIVDGDTFRLLQMKKIKKKIKIPPHDHSSQSGPNKSKMFSYIFF